MNELNIIIFLQFIPSCLQMSTSFFNSLLRLHCMYFARLNHPSSMPLSFLWNPPPPKRSCLVSSKMFLFANEAPKRKFLRTCLVSSSGPRPMPKFNVTNELSLLISVLKLKSLTMLDNVDEQENVLFLSKTSLCHP